MTLTRVVLAILVLLGLSVTMGGAQTIQEQIDEIFSRPELAGNNWTGYVVDESGQFVHYIHQPDSPKIPASNAKIPTTAAAYELLGPDHTFQTRVYAHGTITDGVLDGDLNFVVEHDPTWSFLYFPNSRVPLDYLANRLKTQAGIESVTGAIRIYGASIYDHGTSVNMTQASQQSRNEATAAAMRDALLAAGVSVSGGSFGHAGFFAPGALIHTHESSDVGGYNLDMMIRPLNKRSISPATDMLIRHMGYKLNGDDPASDSYAAGRVHVEAWMASRPFDSTGHVQADGSGQSYNNRLTARIMVGLIRYMAEHHPDFEPSYTIACTDGTLSSRICGPDTSGRARGKTGTLLVTTSLSGYVENQHIGERVYFSFIHNNTGGINQSATRQAVDDAVRVLGGPDVPVFRPPAQPAFNSLRVAGSPPRLLLQWTHTQGAEVYRVYRSVDLGPFQLHAELSVSTLAYLDPDSGSSLNAYRVVASNEDGEGAASDVLMGRIATSAPSVLLVRGSPQTSPTSLDPIPPSMRAVAGGLPPLVGIETAPAARVADGAVDLSRLDAVMWFFEHEYPETHYLNSAERTRIGTYLSSGGAMLLSGAKLASNMDAAFAGNASSGEFLNQVLMHQAVSLDAGVGFVNSEGSSIFAGLSGASLANCDTQVRPVDMVEGLNGARSELVFQPGMPGTAALSYEGAYHLVIFAPSFGCIGQPARVAQYMERILNFLVPPPAGLGDMMAIH